MEQPSIDQSLEPAQLITDAVKRSSKAHLFHFYPILCEIVSIPRKIPTAWVMAEKHAHPLSNSAAPANASGTNGEVDGEKAVELDARSLVKECLKEVGKEMGVGR